MYTYIHTYKYTCTHMYIQVYKLLDNGLLGSKIYFSKPMRLTNLFNNILIKYLNIYFSKPLRLLGNLMLIQ